MAPPSKPPSKPPLKQQTISKFFVPKAITGLAASLEQSRLNSPTEAKGGGEKKVVGAGKNVTEKEVRGEIGSKVKEGKAENERRAKTESESVRAGSKRALERQDDEDDDDKPQPAKRTRGTRRAVYDDDDDDDEDEDYVDEVERDVQRDVEREVEREAPQSSISQRYAFSASRDPNEMDEDEDEDEIKRRQELHRKFVAKLGRPESMPQNNPDAGDTYEEEEGDDDDEPAPPPKKGTAGKKGKAKLTPMEMQFMEIKKKHMDALLIVEVGYKFRFFGEDARIAAKELGIMCIPGKYRYDEHPSEAHLDKFASASIPVHRLPIHTKRLVEAGHKVGVVRQIETTALKKAGDNRNAPFVRKLTNLYTKGTYIDEMVEEGARTTTPGGHLLCLTESLKGEKVVVGMVAVQPTTGDIIYDSFEDEFMRNEIETRLLHISPCEFLVVGDLSKPTDKLLKHLSGTSTNVFGDKSRVERVPRTKTAAAEAYSQLTNFYAERAGQSDNKGDAQVLLDKVLDLPENVTICLAAMMKHLTEYGLEHIFALTRYFESFSTRTHMIVSGTTLESLEVYRNTTDRSEHGSLFWALNKTVTRPGRRLLHKWVGKPLLDEERIAERASAVEELVDKTGTAPVEKLVSVLTSIKDDLERNLIRVYYGKVSRPELVKTLQTLQRIASQYVIEDTGFESALISDAVLALPPILDVVVPYLDRINAGAAQKDDKFAFFQDGEQTDAMKEHSLSIASVKQELDAHRHDAAAAIGKKAVAYATVGGIEYLVEVDNADVKRVPASWMKISGTKKVARFHTPEVIRLMAGRDQHREALAAACDDAFRDMVADLAAEYQPLRDAVAALATLDCLLSLAKVASLPGYSRPKILGRDAPPSLKIEGGRHPVADLLLEDGYIPFSAGLASPSPLTYVITGPNMGGKSSFVRAVALLVVLAQIGSYVPAERLVLTTSDAIFVRMGARDNIMSGESTFMVELGETALVLASATERSLVVLDELGRGTSTYDGAAIAHAVLEHVVRDTRCLTLFITHYQNLARAAEGMGEVVRNVHMSFATSTEENNTTEDDNEGGNKEAITFLYQVAPGMAHRSYGLNVARLAHVPESVLRVAAEKSRQLELETRARMVDSTMGLLRRVVEGDAEEGVLEMLVARIEQL